MADKSQGKMFQKIRKRVTNAVSGMQVAKEKNNKGVESS